MMLLTLVCDCADILRRSSGMYLFKKQAHEEFQELCKDVTLGLEDRVSSLEQDIGDIEERDKKRGASHNTPET